jgi:hypothetical protein
MQKPPGSPIPFAHATCHNAHQWSPVIKEKGDYTNREGNATNSFLRNLSYNNICIDCHGLDALFSSSIFTVPGKGWKNHRQGWKE